MANTREQEYARVREQLDFPLEQSPSPHLIVSELFRQEQSVTNKVNNSKRMWTQSTVAITTVADQAEYTVVDSSQSKHLEGKPQYVYRKTGNLFVPVPFTTYPDEISRQNYEFVLTPNGEGTFGGFVSAEKVSFYRTKAPDALLKMQIHPTPDTAGTVFTVVMVAGAYNREQFTFSEVPILPELSDYRTTVTALTLLPKCKWKKMSNEENRLRREELAASLQWQYAERKEELESYIRSVNHEPIGEALYWWEG